MIENKNTNRLINEKLYYMKNEYQRIRKLFLAYYLHNLCTVTNYQYLNFIKTPIWESFDFCILYKYISA
jgi:hypothetical protein